ncbi:hypothetical protein LQ948_16950 [Jiella sp. MQZ9-1]|uniref:Uncharacterized protein n=1 Tax=Jiella flava TaxID=2816857 RepID=A0A939FYB2_9HYPH|nr:hypothetical protein [Jiella flava]MBO0664253.1 hypothetical protein [Jiella flava]MCD2472899.1 hypothetical protein [Jiella flava]
MLEPIAWNRSASPVAAMIAPWTVPITGRLSRVALIGYSMSILVIIVTALSLIAACAGPARRF